MIELIKRLDLYLRTDATFAEVIAACVVFMVALLLATLLFIWLMVRLWTF